MQKVLMLCLLIVGFSGSFTFADVPHQISYQGRLTDDGGAPLTGIYAIMFRIYDSPTDGINLWQEIHTGVAVEDGLFDVILGTITPMPEAVFNGSNRYLAIALEDQPEMSPRTRIVSVPYAYRSIQADTASYAHASPGGAATGWVDDGSVVRLSSSGDRVGIGTSMPNEKLVVGGDLGSFPEANYIVSGNPNFEEYSGFKLGYNADNHATLNWYGDGDQLRFHTRSMGTDYNNTLVLRSGFVGINNDYPGEPLAIGPDLGAYYGDFVQISKLGSGRYSGFMCGEDPQNQGSMLWNNNGNYLRLGTRENDVDYGLTMVLKEGKVGIGTADPAGLLHVVGPALDASVQLPTGSISDIEIANEAGLAGSWVDSLYTLMDPQPATPIVLDSVIVDAPATGIVAIIASAQVNCYFDPDSPTRVQLDISKTKTPDEDISVGVTAAPFMVDLSMNACVVDYYTVSAGTTVFYFLATRDDPPSGDPVHVRNPRIVAIYSPTWYGAGKSAETSSAGDAAVTVYDAGNFHVDNNQTSVEIAALEARFEAELQAMREEFQQQLDALKEDR